MTDLDPKIIQAIIGGSSALIGGLASTFFAKFFFTRYINDNDKKHIKAEKEVTKVREKNYEELKDIRSLISNMVSDLKVASNIMEGFKRVENLVATDHDSIVKLEMNVDKQTSDINAQHSKIRDIADKMEDVGKAVSSIRRFEEINK